MSRTYNRGPCWVCGKDISCAGFARTAHMRMHVRQGLVIEEVTRQWFGRRFEELRTFKLTPKGVKVCKVTQAKSKL